MPKPMGMSIEVEEAAFGRVFRLLDGMDGVVSINIVGTGPKFTTPKSTQKRGGVQSTGCIILGELMAKEAPMSRVDLRPIVVAGGKKESTMPDTLTKLFKAREIRKFGKGKNVTYAITPTGIKRFKTACQIETEN